MQVERVTRSGAGWTTRWRMTSDGARSWTMDRRCDETGAEEPWLGLSAAGVLELHVQTWRVPTGLALGDAFDGTVEAAVSGLEVSFARSHRAIGRERVTTEAGTFETVHLSVEERTPHAADPTMSQQWLAEGPGLVRMQETGGGAELLYELIDWERVDLP